jgi:tripartite-type tricarboxylate transporter receptor subunit TctC
MPMEENFGFGWEESTMINACRFGATTAIAALLAASVSSIASADEFPSEPIRIVIGFAAGGSTDTNTRALAAAAEQVCNVDIVVSNQPGGSGVIALETVRNAKADGYTIGTTPTEISALEHMGLSDITYRNFVPVMRFIFDPHGFFVSQSSPYKSIADVVQAAKDGKQIRIATSGPASPYAITFEDLARNQGISGKLVNVPYQGDAAAIPAAMSGEVDLLVSNASNVVGQVKSGDLVPLAVASDARIGSFPETPTLSELGMAVNGGSIYGLAVPADTPQDRAAKLGDCFGKAFESEFFQGFIKKSGVNPGYMDAKTYSAYLESEYKRYGELLTSIGLAQ